MGILNDFFHWMMIDDSIRKINKTQTTKVQPKKEYADYVSRQGGFAREKRYLSCVDLSVEDSYEKEFDQEQFEILKEALTLNTARIYKQICYNPSDIEKELILLERCATYCRYYPELIPLIHSRASYIIDHLELSGSYYLFAKQMVYAIDAEAFFLEGNMLNALKRSFSSMNWNLLLEQATIKLGCDMNGLEDLYEALVINILNIYKLLGMQEELKEANNVFSKFINFDIDRYQTMMARTPSQRGNLLPVYNAFMIENRNITSMLITFSESDESEIMKSAFLCGTEYHYFTDSFYPESVMEYGKYLDWFKLTGKTINVEEQADAVREWLNNKL